MRIQHNIMAMNAYRNYNTNTSALAKNLEKLSSGYKINRAGDDAAGLAISEKMRAQITGLNAAQKNVKDGISLVKTAEGAMQEIQDMLNRMDYLATQSANGTYDDPVDRKNLQKEVDALRAEINRIADSANFNGIKLLDGSLAAKETEAASGVDGTEMQDLKVTAGENVTDPVTEIAAKGPSFTATITDFDDTKRDAFKITFTNADGVERTLTLIEDKIDGVTKQAGKGGTDFKTGFDSGAFVASDLDTDSATALAEFKDLFDIKVDANAEGKVSFIARDAESSAKVTKVEKGIEGTANDLATITYTTASGESASAAGPQVKVEVTAANKKTSIKVGGTTYEVNTAEDTMTETEIANELIKALRADGYDASLDPDDTNKKTIVIKNLQEAQKGVQIVNTTTDRWAVTADPSTKGKSVFKIDANDNAGTAAANDTDYKYTLNYINAEGKRASKELTVNIPTGTTADADGIGKALASAINNDSELGDLFKATNASGKLTIESRGSGSKEGAGYVIGLSSDDLKVANDEMNITDPLDTGKTLKTNTLVKKDGTTKYQDSIRNGDKITIDGKTYQFMSDTGASVEEGIEKVAIGDTAKDTWKNLQKALAKNGVESTLLKGGDGLRFVDSPANAETVKSGGLTLQIGDTADTWNQLRVNVGDMHTKAMGTGKTTLDGKEIEVTKTIADIDISNLESAQEAIGVIKNAINYVSEIRGDLGAVQNRLEHTQKNLSVMAENIQDAESTIRDTDVAEEMMAYTKNNILIQSAQAMLAQANAVPQGVLQLLG